MEIGHINHVTIERTPTGKYFVILNVDFDPELRPNAGGKIGIDVGIKAFYSDSNGNTVSNPKYLEKSARKLIREQRKACADHKKAESDHAKELEHCKSELQLAHEKAILELEQKYQATIQKLKEEKQAEIDKYKEEVKAWRLGLDLSKVEGARKLLSDAGISVHIVKMQL